MAKSDTGDRRKLFAELVRQGWRIEKGRKHVKCIPPDQSKPIVVTHFTGGGGRGHRNFVSDLRRSGANI